MRSIRLQYLSLFKTVEDVVEWFDEEGKETRTKIPENKEEAAERALFFQKLLRSFGFSGKLHPGGYLYIEKDRREVAIANCATGEFYGWGPDYWKNPFSPGNLELYESIMLAFMHAGWDITKAIASRKEGLAKRNRNYPSEPNPKVNYRCEACSGSVGFKDKFCKHCGKELLS